MNYYMNRDAANGGIQHIEGVTSSTVDGVTVAPTFTYEQFRAFKRIKRMVRRMYRLEDMGETLLTMLAADDLDMAVVHEVERGNPLVKYPNMGD